MSKALRSIATFSKKRKKNVRSRHKTRVRGGDQDETQSGPDDRNYCV